MISSEHAVALVQRLTTAVICHYRAVNETRTGSPEANAAKERRATIAILKALLEREPTDTEIEDALY